SPCLETLADLVIHRRFPWRVMASHCCSLAFVDLSARARILAKVKAAGIHLVALPACNLVLMGRNEQQAKPRGSLPVDALLKAGVSVCVGTDNVGDYFQPWGDYDPLRNAALCAEMSQLDEPLRVFPLISSAVAAAFNVRDYGIAPGNRADCSLLDTSSLREALAESPLRTHVFFAGKLVLQQQLQQTWS
ncbi:MAG: amidohydrolase family protein, partial [Pseudomonadota bacterium]